MGIIYFLISLKCLLRRPLISIFFVILLTSVTVSLLVGVSLTLITVRGYADIEDDYSTRVTLNKKSQQSAEPNVAYMDFSDIINMDTIAKSELAPFLNSTYVKEYYESHYVPVSSISLRSLDNVGKRIYNVGTVAKIKNIETVDISNPNEVGNMPIRMTFVYYEPLYTFFGNALNDTVIVFLDYEYMSDEQLPSKKIRDILDIGQAYLIKADTIFLASHPMFRSIMGTQDYLPAETLEKLGNIEHILDCGLFDPINDLFIPLDVSNSDEAENHPLVKRAERYQQNLYSWPYGKIHMSVQLVQNLENITPFYYNDLVLTQGRYFSEQEIQNGEAVIIISEDTLNYSRLSIGDKASIMLNQSNEFIDESKEYEIIGAFKSNTDYVSRIYNSVGSYTGNPITYEYNGKAYVDFLQSNGNIIFMPDSSIKTDSLIEDYVANNPLTDENGESLVLLENFYFMLKNSSDINAFINELESSEYIKNNFYISYTDQGYAKAIEVLDQMRITSTVVIVTAFIVTFVTAAFLILLFVSRKSHDVVVMMAMGTKKINIFGTLAWSIVVMYIISCTAGLIIGANVVGKAIDSVTTPLLVEEEFPQFLLNSAPFIQPNLNTQISVSVYFITAGILLAILAVVFVVAVVGKLRHKPSDILSYAMK